MYTTTTPKYTTQTFTSLADTTSYIRNTPAWTRLQSSNNSDSQFTHTSNFEEALKLLNTGYDIDITPTTIPAPTTHKQRQTPSPYGAYASVPRYLSNQPNSMIAFKATPQKQRIITLYKDFSYSSWVSAESIIEYGRTAVAIIQSLEASGVRVNLNVTFFTQSGGETIGFIIPIKKSSERLSIKKMTFPLAHPSMLRRIGFALIERAPTRGDFSLNGYGSPNSQDFIDSLPKGSYHIPSTTLDPLEFARDILSRS